MRTEDTQETGDPYAKARLIQSAIGLGFAALGGALLFFDHPVEGAALIAVGMGLVPVKTMVAPK